MPKTLTLLWLTITLLAATQGCVHRRLTVSTFPEGAVFSVDDQEVGTTPGSTSFTHYGVRKIVIEKPGYRTEELYERIDPPWYLTPPLDFFVENFWPYEIRDERRVSVELVPLQEPSQDELLEQAQGLRGQVQAGQVMPSASSSRWGL